MLLMQQLPERCLINVQMKVQGAQQAGVILHAEEDMKEGYYLYVEPERKRLVYRSWMRMSEGGGKTFPYDVEMETPVRDTGDGSYHMEIVTEGSIGVVYVNDEAALSFRMYDFKDRRLSLFSFGKTVFESVSMSVMERYPENKEEIRCE